MEKWRDVPGYADYAVSDFGCVVSLKRGGRRQLSQYQNEKGYWLVAMSRRGKTTQPRVARLVLLAFVGEQPPKHEASHLDGNKDNNRLSNLCWMTALENHALKKEHGTIVRGERINHAKLTANDVREMRNLYKSMSCKRLGEMFGVHESTAERAIKRITWQHIN